MGSVQEPAGGTGGKEHFAAGKFTVLNDLYVDLLGSLVPGLFTVILGGFILAFTFSTIYGMLFSSALLGKDSFGFVKELVGALHYELAVITVVSAYVVGSVFFRQDPKKPDQNSAVYAWMRSTPDERHGLAVQSTTAKMPRRFSRIDGLRASFWPSRYVEEYELDTQFPYPFLRCYLGARGLTHLTKYVPWYAGRLDTTKGFRTKMFINILKIRLQSLTPELCRDVVRNEAHVRLATSVWYSSTWLFALAAFCELSLVVALSISWRRTSVALQSTYAPGVTSAFVMALCLAMRYQLRKCIHYMRVREVVYVLEAAYIASKREPSFEIENLIEKDMSNECLNCERLKPDGPTGLDSCAVSGGAQPHGGGM